MAKIKFYFILAFVKPHTWYILNKFHKHITAFNIYYIKYLLHKLSVYMKHLRTTFGATLPVINGYITGGLVKIIIIIFVKYFSTINHSVTIFNILFVFLLRV